MRLWSLHPKYLDSKGLVALWREALLAKHVLDGKTKGYKNHPQLDRFKKLDRPLDGINQYLSIVYEQALERGYNFNRDKIEWKFEPVKMVVTTGQMKFEIDHLRKKLKTRDLKKFAELKSVRVFDAHPIFEIVDGDIEEWERL